MSTPLRSWLDLALRIRLCVAVLPLVVAPMTHQTLAVLPWVALIVVLELVAAWLDRRSTGPATLADATSVLAASAVVAGAALGLVGLVAAPLLLVPAHRAGVALGYRAVPLVVGFGAAAEVLVALAVGDIHRIGRQGEVAWLLGGVVAALVGAGVHQRARHDQVIDEVVAGERNGLLRTFEELIGSTTELDVTDLAEGVLGRLDDAVATQQSALFLDHDGWSSTLTVRGAPDLPWREPEAKDSPLHAAWAGSTPLVLDHAGSDGPAQLLCVPLRDTGGHRLGLLAAERSGATFSDADLTAATVVARRAEPLLEAMALFTRLREDTALAERRRLARTMHDGIAQDMAALAYQADAAYAIVHTEAPGASAVVDTLRNGIRGTVVELRTQIGHLRARDDSGNPHDDAAVALAVGGER